MIAKLDLISRFILTLNPYLEDHDLCFELNDSCSKLHVKSH